ncbi:MAG TPA: hypothetical protein VIK86_06410 [Candidatus Paceibacterota bacterium]
MTTLEQIKQANSDLAEMQDEWLQKKTTYDKLELDIIQLEYSIKKAKNELRTQISFQS